MNRHLADQGELGEMTCPFLDPGSSGTSSSRCSSDGSVVLISSRYAAAKCTTGEYLNCSWFKGARTTTNADGKRRKQSVAETPDPTSAPVLVSSLRHRPSAIAYTPDEGSAMWSRLNSLLPSRPENLQWKRPVALLIVLVLAGGLVFSQLNRWGASESTNMTATGQRFPGAVSTTQQSVSKTASKVVKSVSGYMSSITGDKPVAPKGSDKNQVTGSKARRQTVTKRVQAVNKSTRPSLQQGKLPAKTKARKIVAEQKVVEGDYLRKMAKRHYGDEMLWPLIWDYNKKRAAQENQNLVDPDVISSGWTIVIPPKDQGREE